MNLLDRIEEKAHSLRPGRALAAVLAAPFLLVGFLIGLLFRAVWYVLAFAWAACVVAFRKGRGE